MGAVSEPGKHKGYLSGRPSALPLLRLRACTRGNCVFGVWVGFCYWNKTVTDTEEPRYCPMCRAPWVWGNDFCVQCGHFLQC